MKFLHKVILRTAYARITDIVLSPATISQFLSLGKKRIDARNVDQLTYVLHSCGAVDKNLWSPEQLRRKRTVIVSNGQMTTPLQSYGHYLEQTYKLHVLWISMCSGKYWIICKHVKLGNSYDKSPFDFLFNFFVERKRYAPPHAFLETFVQDWKWLCGWWQPSSSLIPWLPYGKSASAFPLPSSMELRSWMWKHQL